MKTIVIVLFVAGSVALGPNIGSHRQVGLLFPKKWEKVLVASAKIRKAVTEGTEEIKVKALRDNPTVGGIIVEALDKRVFDYNAILDKLDAEIVANTLTSKMFKEKFGALGTKISVQPKYLDRLSFLAMNSCIMTHGITLLEVKHELFEIENALFPWWTEP